MAQPRRYSFHIHSSGDQKRCCGMSEAVEGNYRQLIFREPIGIITAENVLQSLIWGGVVHHLPVVLNENPVAALPEVREVSFEVFPGLSEF